MNRGSDPLAFVLMLSDVEPVAHFIPTVEVSAK